MTREPYPQIAHITHGYFSGLLRDCAGKPGNGEVTASQAAA